MSHDWMPTRGPKTRKLASDRLDLLLFAASMEDDTTFLTAARHEIPDAWHTLEMDVPCEAPKEKVTLYLDRSVVRMFRRMGRGYHARINRILETWVQMKMAEKSVFMRDVYDHVSAAEEDKRRPDAGDRMHEVYDAIWRQWREEEGAARTGAQAGPAVP